MRPLAHVFALIFLAGCIPATAIGFPDRAEVNKLDDPTESQVFRAAGDEVRRAAKAALVQNGFVVEKEDNNFIYASERIWARMWSWDYAVGVFFFDESPATRITVVINGAPDIFMPLTLGLGAVAQASEARQMRIQLLNAIRANLAVQK
jgi:hypothetical protein